MKTRSAIRSEVTWKQSFAVRFAAVWAVVLGGAVGFSGWVAHRDARSQLMGNLEQSVVQDARGVDLRLNTWLRTLGEDARSASQSPLVAEFLQARGTDEEARWRALVEDGFRAVFAGKPTYFQMRLLQIGGPGEGREIVRLDRLDRLGEELVVTLPEQLQQKGARGYFQEALSLPDGEVYFSEVNLNRDFGEITLPQLPTIRAAIKIGATPGRRVMLIINADLRPLFAELQGLTSPAAEIYLADEKGDFLMHPDKGATFGTDLGHEIRFHPDEAGADLSEERQVATGHWPGRNLELKVVLPDGSWRPILEQSRWRGIWSTALASLAGAALALLIAWPFARRLGRLSKAIRRFDGTGDDPAAALVDPSRDEIGLAIERFREMAGKVSEHVEDLHRARHDAEEANAAKETFLAVMSHEIRTPMNAVVGLIRVLEANDPPAHQKPILDSLRSSSDNLMTLLNTALDFTRLHEGVIQYASEHFDAAAMGREVIATLKPLAMVKNLGLNLASPASLKVQGDPVRLRQVMNNLLNNAIKFTATGSVDFSLRHEGDQLVGTVADTGPGIREEDRARIFTPFFSRETGADATAPGAGLGLSVSRELIEQQGGSLTFESPLEGGAVFTFRLPYPESGGHVLENGLREPNLARISEGLRVLYVEDTPSNQEVMKLTLAGTGVQLTCANNAMSGLEKFTGGVFDLVMVDLQLPDLSGTELAARILSQSPGLPVIAVTAQSSAKTNEALLEVGIVEVILKPYTKDLVLSALARCVSSGLAEALHQIHPEDPVRAARLAGMMAREFREGAAELDRLSMRDASGEIDEARRALRHRLTTALALFPLHRLERAFDNGGPDSLRALIVALEQAAVQLE